MNRVVMSGLPAMRLLLAAAMVFCGGFLMSGCAEPELPAPGFPARLLPAEQPSLEADVPMVPWLADRVEYWVSGSPTFEVVGAGDLSARGWIAVTREEIRIRVTVSDEVHVGREDNDATGEGDSIRVAIDGRGDGFGVHQIGSGSLSADDRLYEIALTDMGPVIRDLGQGAGVALESRRHRCEIIRSDSVGTTMYDFVFVWRDLDTTPGVSPVFGLGLQVTDHDGPEDQPRQLDWGYPAAGASESQGLQKLRLGSPPGAYGALAVLDPVLWRDGDTARIAVVVSAGRWGQVAVRLDDRERLLAVPPGGREGLQRYVLHVAPPEPVTGRPMRLSAELSAAYGLTMDRLQTTVEPAYVWFSRAMRRLAQLAEDAERPLMQEHWLCVSAICARSWEAAAVAAGEAPVAGVATLTRMSRIAEALADPARDWEDYLLGRRPLLRACGSSQGEGLCLYAAYLPRSWEPQRGYPVTVEMQAAEQADALTAVCEALLPMSIARRVAIASARRRGYVLIAWGDVGTPSPAMPWPGAWRILEDFRTHFRTTEDVTYVRDLGAPAGRAGGTGTAPGDGRAAPQE